MTQQQRRSRGDRVHRSVTDSAEVTGPRGTKPSPLNQGPPGRIWVHTQHTPSGVLMKEVGLGEQTEQGRPQGQLGASSPKVPFPANSRGSPDAL